MSSSSTFNESTDYSAQQEMPILKVSAHWGEVYAFAQYLRDEMVYMGQKTYIANDWGAGIGFEKQVLYNLHLFVDAGYYCRKIDQQHSFNEGLKYLFDKQYTKYEQPNFEKYELKIEPALGLTIGARYYLTKRLSMMAGLHFREHDANIQGRNVDGNNDIYWTMKYKENSNRYFAGVSLDFF